MKHGLVGMPRRHARMAFGPIVGHGVGEDRSSAVEWAASNRTRSGFESLKTRLLRTVKQEWGMEAYSLDECGRPCPRSEWYRRSLRIERMRMKNVMNTTSILTTCRESTVHGMEGYIVHRINHRLILRSRCRITSVALEREVITVGDSKNRKGRERRVMLTRCLFLRHTWRKGEVRSEMVKQKTWRLTG